MNEYHGAYWEKWYVFRYWWNPSSAVPPGVGTRYMIWPGTGNYWKV